MQVSDGTNTDTQAIAVTVTNVNDNTPAITSNGGGADRAVNVAENGTAVTTVTATDADAGATPDLLHHRRRRRRQVHHQCQHRRAAPSSPRPTPRRPTDAGGNNVYDVQVQVSDGTNTDIQDIAVTVTNVNDNTPVITSNGGGATRGVSTSRRTAPPSRR